ncbi:unnamed protein product [Vicia faba]|uniref:SPARK domain-containing protein n=1 Tax=Vicia faba TaxID=3906 RepID=A0AAV1BBS7_VICFA|nr:unnamed protein product [Vicia faba]
MLLTKCFNHNLLLNLFIFFIIPCYIVSLPIPDAATVQTVTTNSSSQGTIPAFPEQADIARCPLSLSDEHFNGIKNACTIKSNKHGRVSSGLEHGHAAASYDMPLLPDDSETCESDLGRALKVRGIELFQPNETCDVVYCYCGVRLHPLSCTESFKVTHSGNLVGNENVKRLETNCLSSSNDVNGFPGLGGCSKCLHSLYLLRKKTSNSSKTGDRTTKIHNKDCELMGLTWLLAKNRTAYIHTVSLVLRALMLSPDGSDPQSCTLNSDGMPLAVDSSEMYDQSSSTNLQSPIFLSLLFLYFVLVMRFILLST